MGAPLNTLPTFFVCQILLFDSIGGLPFSSISAIPSLTSSESSSNDDSTSHIILVNNENTIPTSSVLNTSTPKNFQLIIGLPLGSENNLLPIEGTDNDQTLMADAWTINLPASINIQPNVLVQNPVSEPTSSLNDVTLDTTSQITTTSTSNSVLTIIPKININPVSNGLKRELRDTICASSEEQYSSNNNFPSSPFNSFPSLPQFKPTFPRVNMPCTRCDSEDSSNLSSSVECDWSLSNPARCSSLFTNLSPTPNTLAFDSSNNKDPYFNDLKNYANTRQSVQCFSNDIQNEPNVEPNISPSHMIRLNNNLMKAKALQNNIFTSQSNVNNDANCENSINPNIMTEYQNVLRIRNDIIPKMLSENVAVKSIAQCNDDNIRCPQEGTVSAQNNMPYIQNNNVVNDNCKPASNVNIARMIKDNMNENKNNNQGCPQLRSIPIYNKESLLNKQAASSSNYVDCSQNQNNNICLGQVINQNNQGCPQLFNVAQNNLYQKKNNDANINIENSQICNCENEWNQNNNCNCVQMFTPNDNLAQALQMINMEKSKRAEASATSINILPFGETLIDGQPIGNNFISLDSLSCPAQLPTQSNPISFCTSETAVPSSTNIMLAPSINSVNTISPMIKNIAPSVPNMAITNSPCPQSFVQPFILNQDSFCNNNIQSLNPIITPTFIPIQSLPQVQFVNNIPSSTISVIPSLSLSDTCYSPISNLPSVCTSIQPIVPPSYPLITSNLNQADCISGASAAISPINKIVNSLTTNIMSNLLSKRLPTPPLVNLPPVNPYNCNLITESTASILPIFDIPVACNEYVPPIYSSIVPISTFNPNLFCMETGSCETCVPFVLSLTDAFYPESSFMSVPALTSDSTSLYGSLITPVTLPQAPSVVKINNAVNMCS
ncbi:putative uncharacterized protein DDB_G0282133 [Cydia pomonella]|uniref:putative uncharacterized protein DDB_G0282133 n=1 Tax=Cydia pomonella TaxID=82600 RepID=UPI002ADE00D0|nr:putative uncharacterized protein DDB_G0282133 [Cydia pomonella]